MAHAAGGARVEGEAEEQQSDSSGVIRYYFGQPVDR